MTAQQVLIAILSLPATAQLITWAMKLTDRKTRAAAKERDAKAKADAEAARAEAAKEAAREQRIADLHAEIKHHRITRDAEIVTLNRDIALRDEKIERLREDAVALSETAQAFEVQAAYDRGTIQRLTEEAQRLRRELDDSRRLTRPSDPFRGG